MRLADRVAFGNADVVEAVVANHAAPHRVVEVEDQAAAALAAPRRDHAAHVVGVERQRLVAERQLGEIPHGRVVPGCKADRLGNAGDVEQQVRRPIEAIGDAPVEALAERAPGARRAVVKTAKQGLGRARERLHDAHRAAVLANAAHHEIDMLGRLLDHLRAGRFVAGHRLQRQRAMIEREQHDLGPRAVERRIGRERVLHHLVVAGAYAVQREAVTRGARHQRRAQRVAGGVADEPERERHERLETASACAHACNQRGKAAQLAAVERMPRERHDLRAGRLARCSNFAAAPCEVVGRGGQPAEPEVERGAHRRRLTPCQASCRSARRARRRSPAR